MLGRQTDHQTSSARQPIKADIACSAANQMDIACSPATSQSHHTSSARHPIKSYFTFSAYNLVGLVGYNFDDLIPRVSYHVHNVSLSHDTVSVQSNSDRMCSMTFLMCLYIYCTTRTRVRLSTSTLPI
jgi:hypothetical protein